MRLPCLVLALLLAGCADDVDLSHGPGEPASSPASWPVEVELDDGTLLHGQAIRVSILDGTDGFVQVAVEGSDDAGRPAWSALGVAAVDELEGGELTFELQQLPLADGIANAARHHPDETYDGAESGVFEVSLGADDQADGFVEALPATVSATFRGPFTVSCWVAPEALDQAANGSGDPGGKVRIEDEAFETAFCSRFAAWR
jgi:hypothetical protein